MMLFGVFLNIKVEVIVQIMKFFLIFVEMKSVYVLVIGGGEIVLQKFRFLSKIEVLIIVVVFEFDDDILSFVKDFLNINLLK